MNTSKSRNAFLHVSLGLFLSLLVLTGCDSLSSEDSHGVVDNDFIQVDDYDFEASASFSFEVLVAQHTQVRLDAVNGTVEINGRPDAASVIVTGKRRVRAESMQDAERYLDDLDVRVGDLTDEVFIRTTQPQNPRGRQYIVDYTITLPENLAVSVAQVNGVVSVSNICANTTVKLTNGRIESDLVLPANGTIDLSVVNGHIELAIPASTSAELSASLTHGTISTSNLALEGLVKSPRSMSGTLGSGAGTIDLSTVNGNITVTGHH